MKSSGQPSEVIQHDHRPDLDAARLGLAEQSQRRVGNFHIGLSDLRRLGDGAQIKASQSLLGKARDGATCLQDRVSGPSCGRRLPSNEEARRIHPNR